MAAGYSGTPRAKEARAHARLRIAVEGPPTGWRLTDPPEDLGYVELGAPADVVLAFFHNVEGLSSRVFPSSGCDLFRDRVDRGMAIIDSNGYAHVRLTVTDMHRSKAFYDRVFGWPVALDMSSKVDEPGVRESQEQLYGGIVYQTPDGPLFGLRPVATEGQRFDSEHTGLDHVSFMVASRDAMVSALEGLEAEGIPHGEINDLTEIGIAILSFSDPDGVHLELTAPLS